MIQKKVFAFCGSLRANSSNLALLKALRSALPADTELQIFEKLGELPHYNPDQDDDNQPAVVLEMREQIKNSAAIVISTPEYAHGIPGSLKNALDWLVSSDVVMEKPVGLIYGSSTSASFAHQALVEVLQTMSMNVVSEAIVHLPRARTKISSEGQIKDPAIEQQLKLAVEVLLSQSPAFHNERKGPS